MKEVGLPYPGKAQQPQEQHYPFLSVCAVFLCVQTTVWLPVFGTFNVCAEINACECTRGLYRCCKRGCTKSWLREKSLAAPGTQTCVSVVPWFFSQTMYQLNCYHSNDIRDGETKDTVNSESLTFQARLHSCRFIMLICKENMWSCCCMLLLEKGNSHLLCCGCFTILDFFSKCRSHACLQHFQFQTGSLKSCLNSEQCRFSKECDIDKVSV